MSFRMSEGTNIKENTTIGEERKKLTGPSVRMNMILKSLIIRIGVILIRVIVNQAKILRQ